MFELISCLLRFSGILKFALIFENKKYLQNVFYNFYFASSHTNNFLYEIILVFIPGRGVRNDMGRQRFYSYLSSRIERDEGPASWSGRSMFIEAGLLFSPDAHPWNRSWFICSRRTRPISRSQAATSTKEFAFQTRSTRPRNRWVSKRAKFSNLHCLIQSALSPIICGNGGNFLSFYCLLIKSDINTMPSFCNWWPSISGRELHQMSAKTELQTKNRLKYCLDFFRFFFVSFTKRLA